MWMWMWLACSPGYPEPPTPACPGESEILDLQDETDFGFSPQALLDALPAELELPVVWDDGWGPPQGVDFHPTLRFGELDGAPERLLSAADCEERMLVPVALQLSLVDGDLFNLQSQGQVSGTPTQPTFSMGYHHTSTQPETQVWPWIDQKRQSAYDDPWSQFTSDDPIWYRLIVAVNGDAESGRLVIAQAQGDGAWAGPRILFQGRW